MARRSSGIKLLAPVVCLLTAGLASFAVAPGAGSTSTVTAASKCVSRQGLPDPRCTPGAFNPSVTQRTIGRTICVPGWTDKVRPPTSYTDSLKVPGIADYGFKDKTLGHYEEDHLVPLAVGGSPRSPRNLWPEPYKGRFGARVKDRLERFLHDQVCDGAISLAKARRAFPHWRRAFKRFFASGSEAA